MYGLKDVIRTPEEQQHVLIIIVCILMSRENPTRQKGEHFSAWTEVNRSRV
jgi:hypothetical protein